MSQERVKSKNLFNFRPQGFIDPVVVAEDEKMKQDFGLDPVAMEEHMKTQSESEFVEEMRGFMGGFLGNTPFKTDPAYVEVLLSDILKILFTNFELLGVRFVQQF